jgi:hypothetical protein
MGLVSTALLSTSATSESFTQLMGIIVTVLDFDRSG